MMNSITDTRLLRYPQHTDLVSSDDDPQTGKIKEAGGKNRTPGQKQEMPSRLSFPPASVTDDPIQPVITYEDGNIQSSTAGARKTSDRGTL